VLLCITWLHLPQFKQLKTNVVLKDADAWVSELTVSYFQNEVLMREVTGDGYASVRVRVTPIRTEVVFRAI
ncbi:40S ribosomal protein S3-1-like protein, partial [Tanacetum coccineum]